MLMSHKNSQAMIAELHRIHKEIKPRIIYQLARFRGIWLYGDDMEILKELIFCLLTPQSKAKICWKTVENLEMKRLLLKGDENELVKEMKNVRFRYKKAKYIVEAREKFIVHGRLTIKHHIKKFQDVVEARDWLVRNIRGMGYKEASHFLRNIGMGQDIAILDRHILKNIRMLRLIEEIPMNLSRKKYVEIEKIMTIFSKIINIPLSHLDFVLWYKDTHEVFK